MTTVYLRLTKGRHIFKGRVIKHRTAAIGEIVAVDRLDDGSQSVQVEIKDGVACSTSEARRIVLGLLEKDSSIGPTSGGRVESISMSKLGELLRRAAQELDTPAMSNSKKAELISELEQQRVACIIADPKTPVGVDNILSDEADLLGSEVPATSIKLLHELDQELEKTNLRRGVVFLGDDNRVYEATYGVNLHLAPPDLVEELNIAVCDNCSYISYGKHDRADIVNLTQRVSPGEPFPSGQCPECGALMHPLKQHE